MVLAGVVALATITWLATADIRTSRAISFDQDSRSALNDNDLGRAYQKAEFAYALSPSDDRAITLGSLAYLRRQYQAAERYFHTANDGEGGLAEQAKVGEVAAAAQNGDESDFRRAIDEAGSPGKDLKLPMANALINGGDLDQAADLLAKERVDSQNISYAKSIGLAEDDVAAAQAAQVEARSGFSRLSFANPAFERFVRQLIAVPRNGNRTLSDTFVRMSAAANEASQKVILAETLYEFGEYHAAKSLADTAVREEPAYRDAWNVLAATQISERDYHAADRSLKVSLELDRGYGYTWYLRSQLAERQNQDKKADEYRTRADELGYQK